MSLIAVMTQAGSLGHKAGSVISGGVFTITSAPSLKVKAGGQGVYRGIISFTFAGGNASGFIPGTVAGGGAISPTAIKTKADGQIVIRDGDFVLMSATGTISSTPFPSGPVAGNVEVSDPGQTKMKAQ